MSDKPSPIERVNERMRNSVTLKMITMGTLVLLLLIPAWMIESLIREREGRRGQAIHEISQKWGNQQTLTGPILAVPYLVHAVDDDENVITTRQRAFFLPDVLHVDGTLEPETRYRGIYEAVVYRSTLRVSGSFNPPDFSIWSINAGDILWDEASLHIGLSDLRGVDEQVVLDWNGQSLLFDPGITVDRLVESGISAQKLMLSADSGPIDYAFDLTLKGSSSIMFTPVGKETNVALTSAWDTPSFDGAFLPDERDVSEDGFTASWTIFHLNRNYPQQWRNANVNLLDSSFGARLLLPVDQYQKTMRASKYAVLVIVFTFLVFFFAEVRNKERIHPIPYLLVGLALCLFYTLLLAISEHSTFGISYVVSGLATIGLITLYTRALFVKQYLSWIVAGVLSTVYVFVFVILQLEDFALLVGTVGLFAALAITMYLSRSIDWFNKGRVKEHAGSSDTMGYSTK